MHFDSEPIISVGILETENPEIAFSGNFVCTKDENGEKNFAPQSADCRFTIKNVVIGKKFHWERFEDQSFRGSLSLRESGDGKQLVINRLPLEDYLKSVISSEMSANASPELLKAHAVISRSWALRILLRNEIKPYPEGENPLQSAGLPEISRWQDRDDHTLFDVCADDHCQRYQGTTRETTPEVERAVEATRGMILEYDGEVCDARFSKCCGGISEEFSTCWQPVEVPYLESIIDSRPGRKRDFCDTTEPEVLRQILNNYDLETPDFYRWKVSFTTNELSEIIRNKTGKDFGTVIELIPIERGLSGRISRLLIRGSKRSEIIGKELEIRQTLSPSCLKSSWFDVERTDDGFTLHGRGWGHGVGLCQIGAAVMAHEGYDFREILSHYYPKANIKAVY